MPLWRAQQWRHHLVLESDQLAVGGIEVIGPVDRLVLGLYQRRAIAVRTSVGWHMP